MLRTLRGVKAFFLITPECDYLFTDFRYIEQAHQDIPWIKIVEKKKFFGEDDLWETQTS